jgi:SAM-dependent methyltransferase
VTAPTADPPPPDVGILDPLHLYAEGLAGRRVFVRSADGRRVPLPVRRWIGNLQAGDEELLSWCAGPTLDVGCGPGRLSAALRRRGVPALGIDVSTAALARARAAGATVLHRDVFADVPGTGRWARLLIADGNVGIGGDPVRLLSRARELLDPNGLVLVELAAEAELASGSVVGSVSEPGTRQRVRLEDDRGGASAWFRWASLGVAGLHRAAPAAGLAERAVWRAAGRSFAALGPVSAH